MNAADFIYGVFVLGRYVVALLLLIWFLSS